MHSLICHKRIQNYSKNNHISLTTLRISCRQTSKQSNDTTSSRWGSYTHIQTCKTWDTNSPIMHGLDCRRKVENPVATHTDRENMPPPHRSPRTILLQDGQITRPQTDLRWDFIAHKNKAAWAQRAEAHGRQKEMWAGAFTATTKALIKCVTAQFNNIHMFSPYSSWPAPLPTVGHTSQIHEQSRPAWELGTLCLWEEAGGDAVSKWLNRLWKDEPFLDCKTNT